MYFSIIGTYVEYVIHVIWIAQQSTSVTTFLGETKMLMERTTRNRKRITFMTDIDVLADLENCFPGVSKSAQVTIALRNYLNDVKRKAITLDDVVKEIKRVQDRAFGRTED